MKNRVTSKLGGDPAGNRSPTPRLGGVAILFGLKAEAAEESADGAGATARTPDQA